MSQEFYLNMSDENASPEGSFENQVSASGISFFSATPLKFVVMSVCTFGIYQIYWFYKNWKLIKERTGQKIWPFWRAVFSPIWAYSCFKEINSCTGGGMPIGLLAIAYFTLNIIWWPLPDPYWLISILGLLPLIPANSAAIKVNQHSDAGYMENGRFSALNWVGIVVGGSISILALIGTFAPNAFSSEEVAQIDNPKSYNKGGVTFEYPGNWSITEDGGQVSEGSARYLVLETAGENVVSIQVYPAVEASELLEYAQWYSSSLAEEIPLGSFGATEFFDIEEKDGIELLREGLEMTLLGEITPYTRIYCKKRVGNATAFVMLQVVSEEFEMVVGGFEQIVGALSYEGP